MDPIFHADYPLLLAMNTASGWDTLGNETPHVPMTQSALFAIACAGLLKALPTVEFAKVPLAQFVEFIGDFTNLPITIDERALRAIGKGHQAR